MFGHGNKFGTTDDVKARINDGHKLEATIFVAEWEEGNGFSSEWEMDIADYVSRGIVENVASGKMDVDSFVKHMDGISENERVTISVFDRDDDDFLFTGREVWSDYAWGEKHDEQ